ncbi:HNH endonuclease signature motif containing protein, partial [Demequina iriomotensis]|uniref:HNH endonuclease signature motif containing protein n=1 Tax=Demequina iriomotensis TaxID=1536641 RepID=UPI000785299F
RGGGMARRHGHRNANQMVAKGQGGTGGQARDAIVTGTLLADDETADEGPTRSPVAAAVLAGELSAAQARVIAETLEQCEGAPDTLAATLVDKARRLTLADLRKACLDVVARWDVDRWQARQARQRAERYLQLSERADGMVTLTGLLDPASGAVVKTWCDAQVAAGFARRRDQGLSPADPGEAGRLRVDALVDLARHGMRCDQPGAGVSTTVVVRVDYEVLKTGTGLGACDAIATPLSGGDVRRLAVDMRILPVVLGTGSHALDVGFAKRFFTPAQRIALAERDGGCAFCHAPVSWCDAHHIREWSLAGRSDLANGVLLCTRCHHRIHDDGWTIRATPTQVWFIPPTTIDPARTPRQGGKAALHIDLPHRTADVDAESPPSTQDHATPAHLTAATTAPPW